jgi:pimeloyl-ACP methyl ester carboxylesterase
MLTTSEGELFYAQRGAGGQPVIFLHGAGGHHQHWGLMLKEMGQQVRLLALDLPGHGRSALPGRTTIEGYRDTVLAFCDALNLELVMLVGHSMGGAIALQLALDAPERVAGVLLVAATARMRVGPMFLDGWETKHSVLVERVVEWCYPPTTPAEQLAAARADYARTDPLVFRDDFRACNYFNVEARLNELRCRLGVVVGGDDRMVRLKDTQLVSQTAGALFYSVLSGEVGHLPMITAPQALAQQVERLLYQQ